MSVDTPKQAQVVWRKHGARTFRVKTPDSPVLPGEINCPFYDNGEQCITCMKCNGDAGPNICVNVHGATAPRYIRKYGRANQWKSQSTET